MPNPSRRAILGGGATLAAAVAGASLGFSHRVHHKVALPPAPAPASLITLLGRHRELQRAGEAAARAGVIGTSPLMKDLGSHVEALLAVLQTYPGWRYVQDAGLQPSATSGPIPPASTPAPSNPASSSPASSSPASSSPASSSPASSSPASSSTVAPIILPTRIGLRDGCATQAAQLAGTCQAWTATEGNSETVVPLLASMSASMSVHAGRLSMTGAVQ